MTVEILPDAHGAGPSMHLWPEPEAASDLGVRRACRIERCGPGPRRDPVTLWYSLPDLGGEAPAEPDEAFLIAGLIQAMAEGRDLVLHGAASAELLGNLAEFRDAWHRWQPDSYATIDISAERVTPRGAPRSFGAGVATSYSGGIDSTATIWRHASGLAGHGARRITHAVFAHGFDIPLSDVAAFEAGCDRARPLLEALGIALVPVRTNFREALPYYWEMAYGVALASCFHQLGPSCGEALVASSRTFDVLFFPMGSNAMTDGFLSSATLRIVEDGAGRNRCEKVAELAGWPAGLAVLRVCWQGSRRDRNCGECEKCVRTMHNFLAVGLPIPPCFDRAPTLAQVRAVKLSSRSLVEEWDQLAATAEENGIRAPWVNVARRKVVRWRVRSAVREAARQVARATLPTGVRRFVGRTVFA
ncbi:MAG TPA: hypothetical protein VK688_12370 [Gemmatimonadales bacterium]|nr:hypothetical protein [Gemmatimonadales bacterium]